MPSSQESGRTWRQRLAGIRSYPSKSEMSDYLDGTVHPAMVELVEEFQEQGHEAVLDVAASEHPGLSSYLLSVTIPDHQDFVYRVEAVEAPVPTFGGRAFHEKQVYYRAEVFAQTGSEGYDLMGATGQQIIDDVLGRYEGHLDFLTHLGTYES